MSREASDECALDFQFLQVISQSGPMALAAFVTIYIGALSCLFGLAIGTILLVLRNVRFWPVPRLVRLYGSFIRGTPALVQILVFYYALPPLIGLDIGPLTAGILAISFNSGAYVAEILRGGLSRIPPGQFEAATALGLSRFLAWRKIILPQVYYSVIPLLVNEFTMVIKITPLLSTITVVELTREAQYLITSTFRPVEVLSIAAAIYFVICFSISQLAEILQRRTRKFQM